MESSPEDYKNSRYRKACNGYHTYYLVDDKKLYKDFFKLINEDTIILAMMSSSEKILDYSRKAHNKKVGQGMLDKLKDLFV